MSVFAWKEEYSVGIREIDDQHKKLVAMVNDMYKAMAEGKGRHILGDVLQRLIAYTQYHFSSEEALLEKYGFPDFHSHKVVHDKMTKKVLELQKQFEESDIKYSIEVAKILQDWLNRHILETDKEYSSFLTKKGVT